MDECLAGRILEKKLVTQKRQHVYRRSTEASTVWDRYLTVVAQPQSEDVEVISTHVLKEYIPQELLADGLGSRQLERISP